MSAEAQVLSPSGRVSEEPGIAQAAGIIALGNVASRILGLGRETVISHFFGASGKVSAFRAASIIPTLIYDLLIGGMLSAALVPVFSEYISSGEKEELWHLASVVLSCILTVLLLVVLVLEVGAAWAVRILVSGFNEQLLTITTDLVRLVLPAVLLFGCTGILTALLYSLKRFTYPAFGAAVYNLGILIAAPLLARSLGIRSLAVGILLGACFQLAILLPDLRGIRLRFSLDFSHPALRRILILYLPIALGLVVSEVQVVIDRSLASRTASNAALWMRNAASFFPGLTVDPRLGFRVIAWMSNATTLIQFPHGLIPVAVSLATLPTLSAMAARGSSHEEGFQATFAQGMRMILAAIIPAIVGLFVLARPIIALLFEHGKYTAVDTAWAALALRFYLLGLFFASIDWPLYYAFYARQNTLVPAAVGVFSVLVYLVVALALIGPWGMIGLVLADSAKHASHALTMLVLFWRRMGVLRGQGVIRTGLKATLASAVMGLAVYLGARWLEAHLGGGLPARAALVIGTGGMGVLIYLAMATLLRMEEVRLVGEIALRKMGLGRSTG